MIEIKACGMCSRDIDPSCESLVATVDDKKVCPACIESLEAVLAKCKKDLNQPFESLSVPLVRLEWSALPYDCTCAGCGEGLSTGTKALCVGLGYRRIAEVCESCAQTAKEADVSLVEH